MVRIFPRQTSLRTRKMRAFASTLPHGYGMRYRGSAPIGPELNRLTRSDHCDPLTRTSMCRCACWRRANLASSAFCLSALAFRACGRMR